MELVYVHDNGEEEVLVEVITNHTMSVENILDLSEFDLEEWSKGNPYKYESLIVRN